MVRGGLGSGGGGSRSGARLCRELGGSRLGCGGRCVRGGGGGGCRRRCLLLLRAGVVLVGGRGRGRGRDGQRYNLARPVSVWYGAGEVSCVGGGGGERG